MNGVRNRTGECPPFNGCNSDCAEEKEESRSVPTEVFLRLYIVTELADCTGDKMRKPHPESANGTHRKGKLLFRLGQRLRLA
jgi:hypothetical protein